MKRLRAALNVWRDQGRKGFSRRVLLKLGLTRSFDSPIPGANTFRLDIHRRYGVREIVDGRFGACAPLRLFSVPPARRRRVSVVTDSINSGSLYGGVGTAMILAAQLADALQARLRIVTRTERARYENLHHVLDLNGIRLADDVEFAFAPFWDDDHEIDVFDDELFLTTSWWTTAATMASVPHEAIVYLLQEDERTFHPFDDERLRCERVLASRDIRFVLNTRLLFDHFSATGPNAIAERGMWFEPAFPREVFHPRGKPESGKRRLLFYARPHNGRNLFYLGVELLDEAIARGIVDLDEWEILLLGRDLPELEFFSGYVPERRENLSWAEYAELVGTVDLGLCLMYSVHPSYPPFDLAASGAVVVTNRWGGKQTLSGYSKNILCGDPDREAMLSTLAEGIRLATDSDRRTANHRATALGSSWREALGEVVAQIATDR
jgi:O-antigen biosynthesis protein